MIENLQVLHPNPSPTQIKSFQVYIYYLISVLSLFLSVWRLSSRICSRHQDLDPLETGHGSAFGGCNGRRRQNDEILRRILIHQHHRSSPHRSTPPPISLNFIMGSSFLQSSTPHFQAFQNPVHSSPRLNLTPFLSPFDHQHIPNSPLGNLDDSSIGQASYGSTTMSARDRYLLRRQWIQRSRALKQDLFIDVIFTLGWLSWSTWTIGFTDRCPIGHFQGW